MKVLNFTAPLQLRAEGSEKLPTRFSGTAYSGGLVPGYGVVIDVDSTKVEGRMQLLAEHDRGMCAGVVEQAAKQGGQIIVSGRLFSDLKGQIGERVAQLAVRGVPFELSVGLYHYREEFIGRNQAATVNGKTIAGPVTVLRDGRVREVSVVALGADPQAKARLFSHGRQTPMPNATDIYRRLNATDKF